MSVSPSGQASEHPSGKSPQELRRGRLAIGTCVLLVLVAAALLLILPWVVVGWDKTHRTSIDCTVTEAEGVTDRGTSRAPTSRPEIMVTTSDCGTLLLKGEISDSNQQKVVAELAEGGRFSFVIGEATQNLRWLTDTINVTPEVWSHEKID